jgi:hypothetical protein
MVEKLKTFSVLREFLTIPTSLRSILNQIVMGHCIKKKKNKTEVEYFFTNGTLNKKVLCELFEYDR